VASNSPIAVLYCDLRLRRGINFSDYKILADWLCLYCYQPANHRYHVSRDLGVALAIFWDGNLTAAWHCYNDCTHFNPLIQEEILQWILTSESKHFPIHLS